MGGLRFISLQGAPRPLLAPPCRFGGGRARDPLLGWWWKGALARPLPQQRGLIAPTNSDLGDARLAPTAAPGRIGAGCGGIKRSRAPPLEPTRRSPNTREATPIHNGGRAIRHTRHRSARRAEPMAKRLSPRGPSRARSPPVHARVRVQARATGVGVWRRRFLGERGCGYRVFVWGA